MSFKVGDVIKTKTGNFYRLVLEVYGWHSLGDTLKVENLEDGHVQDEVYSSQYELVDDIEILRKFYE